MQLWDSRLSTITDVSKKISDRSKVVSIHQWSPQQALGGTADGNVRKWSDHTPRNRAPWSWKASTVTNGMILYTGLISPIHVRYVRTHYLFTAIFFTAIISKPNSGETNKTPEITRKLQTTINLWRMISSKSIYERSFTLAHNSSN